MSTDAYDTAKADDRDYYISLMAMFVNDLVELQIITPGQRGEIHRYWTSKIEGNRSCDRVKASIKDMGRRKLRTIKSSPRTGTVSRATARKAAKAVTAARRTQK